jgi:YVTN family beta-propeller protein
VVNLVGNDVTVITGGKFTSTVPTGTYPNQVSINSQTNKIYVSSPVSNQVTVIDGKTNAIVAVISGLAPSTLAVDELRNKIYTATSGQSISVIDGVTNTVSMVSNGYYVFDMAVDVLTNRIYTTNLADDSVEVVSGASGPLAVPLVNALLGAPNGQH